jgi:hypothetical protein
MPQQVTRLGIAFAVLAVVFLAVRQQLVPDTFGEKGHYRAAAVDSIAAYPLQYAGHEECTLCHRPIAERRSASGGAPRTTPASPAKCVTDRRRSM